MNTTNGSLQAENERLAQRVAELERMLAERDPRKPTRHTANSAQIDVLGVPIVWQLDQGVCTFQGAAVGTMFITPTLAGLMSGFQKMVGTERFFLAMQSEGRRNIDIDWEIITSEPTFEQGFASWARFPILAGWGRWEIAALDQERKECHIRVHNSFEGLYQQALGVCWGSGVAAGKCSGIFSLLFETNCWAEQVEYLAQGDPYDSFIVRPSDRSIEQEIDNLLLSDEATRADLAVALQKLREEVNQRRQAEQALRVSEERFRTIADYTYDWEYWRDPDATFSYMSPACERITGYRVDEFLADADLFVQIVHPDDQPILENCLEVAQQESEVPPVDFRIITRAGETRWIGHASQPVYREDGQWLGTRSSNRDVTAQKSTELDEQKRLALIENSSDFVGLATMDGQALYLNPAGRQMVGVPDDADITTFQVADFLMPEDIEHVTHEILPVVMRDGQWEGEYRFRHIPTSTDFPVYYNVFLVVDPMTKAPLGLGTVTRDISTVKQQELEREALQQQVIEAQQAALRELSTPLIPLTDDVLIMPLIGAIDSQRAQQVMETLLEGVAAQQARTVILDITGVQTVDTKVANAFIQAAQAVRLLGAQVVLTGIQPQIAQTLVALGVKLSGIVTYGSLQAGIAAVLR